MHCHVPLGTVALELISIAWELVLSTPAYRMLEPAMVPPIFMAELFPVLSIKAYVPTAPAVAPAVLFITQSIPAVVTVASSAASSTRGAPAVPSAIAIGLSRNAVTVAADGKPPTPTAVLLKMVKSVTLAP